MCNKVHNYIPVIPDITEDSEFCSLFTPWPAKFTKKSPTLSLSNRFLGRGADESVLDSVLRLRGRTDRIRHRISAAVLQETQTDIVQ